MRNMEYKNFLLSEIDDPIKEIKQKLTMNKVDITPYLKGAGINEVVTNFTEFENLEIVQINLSELKPIDKHISGGLKDLKISQYKWIIKTKIHAMCWNVYIPTLNDLLEAYAKIKPLSDLEITRNSNMATIGLLKDVNNQIRQLSENFSQLSSVVVKMSQGNKAPSPLPKNKSQDAIQTTRSLAIKSNPLSKGAKIFNGSTVSFQKKNIGEDSSLNSVPDLITIGKKSLSMDIGEGKPVASFKTITNPFSLLSANGQKEISRKGLSVAGVSFVKKYENDLVYLEYSKINKNKILSFCEQQVNRSQKSNQDISPLINKYDFIFTLLNKEYVYDCNKAYGNPIMFFCPNNNSAANMIIQTCMNDNLLMKLMNSLDGEANV